MASRAFFAAYTDYAIHLGHEEEVSPQHHDYYEDASYDDNYSPSPPRASGGAFFPATNEFPPPPPPGGYTQPPAHINDFPAHPYNPADYVNEPPPNDPYHAPRGGGREGENVSSTREASIGHTPPNISPFSPVHNESEIYTPTPISPQPQNNTTAVYPEDRLNQFPVLSHPPQTTLDPPSHINSGFPFPITPHQINNPASTSIQPQNMSYTVAVREPSPPSRSVKFAPLSPNSTRSLPTTSKNPAKKQNSTSTELDYLSPASDDSNDPNHTHHNRRRHHRHHRRRRNSDPSSNRPNTPSKHRRRQRRASRSPSPESADEIEVLPDRFDKDGRYIGRDRSLSRDVDDGQQEMVERLVSGFGDMVEGRASWKDLLKGVLGSEILGGGSDSEGSQRRRGHDW